ncbi:MAG: hypothetical protein VB022_08720 [Rikenellaceae bacterium]|nr:hypothetical protein [Rikenellaceae bacterium]
MLKKIIFYQAVDAFLYLPTYLARDLDIFKTLLNSEFEGVEIVLETLEKGGDKEAINSMLINNLKGIDEEISFAISDPLAVLSQSYPWANDIEKSCIVASIINKLPFWVVNHDPDEVLTRKKIPRQKYKQLIYYNDSLVTGNYLGKEILKEIKIKTPTPVDFREEWDHLKTHNIGGNSNAIAITADIVSLAKGMQLENKEKLAIKYRFSNEGEFLTTGIITSKNVCEKYPTVVTKIIEGIQKSISIIYSSSKTAIKTCEGIVEDGKIKEPIDKKDIDIIVGLINKEKFYPADLNISKKCWDKALLAFSKAEQWDNKTTKRYKRTSFRKFVCNKYVYNSEKSIAKQFGISIRTYSISPVIRPLAVIFSYPVFLVGNFLYWYKNINRSLAVLIATASVFILYNILRYRTDLNSMLEDKVNLIFLIPIIINLLTSAENRRNNQKQD